MSLVVGEVGEERLVDVEDPRVPPVGGDHNGLCELQRVFADDCGVREVPVPGHVVLDELLAPRGDGRPFSSVVGLDGEPPAIAVEAVFIPEELPAPVTVEPDDRWRGRTGSEAHEEK